MYSEAQVNGIRPPTLTEAKGKDVQEGGFCCPKPLLNVDGKLFAKILSNRPSPLMNKLIHLDQTSVIANRNFTFNSRRLFNITYTNKKGTEAVLLPNILKLGY